MVSGPPAKLPNGGVPVATCEDAIAGSNATTTTNTIRD